MQQNLQSAFCIRLRGTRRDNLHPIHSTSSTDTPHSAEIQTEEDHKNMPNRQTSHEAHSATPDPEQSSSISIGNGIGVGSGSVSLRQLQLCPAAVTIDRHRAARHASYISHSTRNPSDNSSRHAHRISRPPIQTQKGHQAAHTSCSR